MNSELIKRLWVLDMHPESAPRKAADEIERLSDALTTSQEENERLVHDIERLSASLSAEVTENERLREALEEIEADCEADYPPSHGAIKYADRAALDGLPK